MNTMEMLVSRSGGRSLAEWRGALLASFAAMALGLGATALVGCGGGDEENNAGTGSGAATTTPGTEPGAGAGAGAGNGEPTPSSNGASGIDSPSGEASTQGTVAGTLELFIAAMEEGDFLEASRFVDESTDLYADLLKMVENVEAASEIDDPQAGNMGEFVRLSFAVTFAGTDYEIVSEDGSRARAVLTVPGANNEQHSVDLNQVEGNWYIVAGRGLLRSSGNPPPPPIPAQP